MTANGSDSEDVSLTDFYAYMPSHNYIFRPTREMWPGGSVNARIRPIRASIRRENQSTSPPAPGSTATDQWSR